MIVLDISTSPHHHITTSPHHRITASPHHPTTASRCIMLLRANTLHAARFHWSILRITASPHHSSAAHRRNVSIIAPPEAPASHASMHHTHPCISAYVQRHRCPAAWVFGEVML